MQKSVRLLLLAVVVLAALVMSACSGVQAGQGFGQNFQDQSLTTGFSANSVNSGGSFESQSQSETKMPKAQGETQSSNEVTGTVTAMDANTITVNGVVYNLANFSEIQGNIQVGDTVKLEFVTNPDGSLSIRETKVVSGASQETETPEPTETAEPSDSNEVTGVVTAMDATTITVDGVVYNLSDFTEVKDNIQVGDTVKLEFVTNPDGTLTVREVQVSTSMSEDSGSGSGSSHDGSESSGSDDSHSGSGGDD